MSFSNNLFGMTLLFSFPASINAFSISSRPLSSLFPLAASLTVFLLPLLLCVSVTRSLISSSVISGFSSSLIKSLSFLAFLEAVPFFTSFFVFDLLCFPEFVFSSKTASTTTEAFSALFSFLEDAFFEEELFSAFFSALEFSSFAAFELFLFAFKESEVFFPVESFAFLSAGRDFSAFWLFFF